MGVWTSAPDVPSTGGVVDFFFFFFFNSGVVAAVLLHSFQISLRKHGNVGREIHE